MHKIVDKNRHDNDAVGGLCCPLCGIKLTLLERTPPPEIDWGSDDTQTIKRQETWWKHFEKCKRDEYACPNGHFEKDFPLYHHQPFQGIDSAPGDSWSLSWVK